MMPNNYEFDRDELAQLIDALICGTITEVQFEELSEKIAKDPAAREFYISEIEIESNLQGLSKVQKDALLIFPDVTKTHGWSASWIGSLLCTAAVLAIVTGFFLNQNWQGGNPDQPRLTNREKTLLGDQQASSGEADVEAVGDSLVRSVARITNGKSIAWKDGGDLGIGSWLKPAKYELASGELEVTFDSGAVVFIAAGANFEIINSNEVRLQRGSLQADVPKQAIGFKVQTPSGEITDLSTKFGVNVSEKGESDVHVLKGLVEAKPAKAQQKLVTLKEKSAIRMFPDSPPEAVEFSSHRLFEIGSRKNKDKLNFLHFSFDGNEVADGVLKNSGLGGEGRGGRIVNGGEPNAWVQVDGPFGKSLYFSGEGARIETQIKGIDGNRARTLVFWVRINPETPIQSAYAFASWGLSEGSHPKRGFPGGGQKWQIGWNPNYVNDDEGTMGAIRTEFGGGYVIGSTDLRDGRWHHVASVFIGGGEGDNVANLVRHYIDGKLESVSGFKEKTIRTQSNQESLSIGEYVGAGHQIFTGYKGWIDEFYLFDKALTPSQIVQVMEQNQPPAAAEIVAENPD